MNEKKSLKQTIQEDLIKTGYPTEIISANIMQQKGWGVAHNPSYWDNEENHSREFDIRAYKQWENSAKDFNLGVYIIAECKKSEKPWVFFTTNEKYLDSRLGRSIKARSMNKQLFTDHEHPTAIISNNELQTIHHYFQKPKQARTFHEPLKQQEKSAHSQMIYTAVMATVKATLFHYRENALPNDWIGIFYPLIIFSGNLFEAFVNPDKSIDLTETSHIQLKFNYIQQEPSGNRSIWSANQPFTIDVIHEDYLDQFLGLIEVEHQIIANKI